MSLPKIQTPEYELTLPSTGEKIKYRPFLVKEEKIFLMALESKDTKEMLSALRQIIRQCTFDVVDVNKIPNFDLEYIFIKLRSKSVGSEIELSFNGKDGEPIPVTINLDDVEIIKGDCKDVIMLDDKIGLKMRYPIFEQIENYVNIDNEYDLGLAIIEDCIESVFDEDSVTSFHDETEDDRKEFINSLGKEHYTMIMEFFNSMPKLQLKVNYVDGEEEKEVILEGLSDFFM